MRYAMKLLTFLIGLGIVLCPGQSPASDCNTDSLFWAARNDVAEAVRQCVASGADVNAGSEMTPLHVAAHYGHVRVAMELIRSGANVNAKGQPTLATPLHIAAANGHALMVQLLIAAGADVNAKMSETLTDLKYSGMTPLEVARLEGKTEVVRFLESCKPPVTK